MTKHHSFTLVEILVVVGIILILAAMLLSAAFYAPKKAKMAAAKADITALVNAIKQFEADYGAFPVPKDTTGDTVTINKDYQWFIQVLQGEDLTDNDTGDPNSRRRKYLDIQGNEKGSFKDPWDQNYIITLNLKYDGQINSKDTNDNNSEDQVNTSPIPDGITDSKILRDIVVWSKGPDKKSASAPDSKRNKDNIYSVNTNWDPEKGHTITR